MLEEDAKLTGKGQVTIPKSIREKLGLDKGSKVSFRVRNGEAVMVPKSENPVEELRKLREKISFSDQEIEYMIRDSKETWSSHK